MAEVIGSVVEIQLKISYTKTDGDKQEIVTSKTVRINEQEATKIGALIFSQDTYKKILAGDYTNEVIEGLSQIKKVSVDEKAGLTGQEDGKNTLAVIYKEPCDGDYVLLGCSGIEGHPKTWDLQ